MIKSIFLSISALNNKTVQHILVKSIMLTIAVLIALALALFLSGDYLLSQWGWGMDIGTWSYLMSVIIGSLISWFFFRSIAILILWIFADDIVEAIEWEYYSHSALTATKPSWITSLAIGLRSLLRAIVYNLLALPLYLIALFSILGTPIIFLCINGLLLGKELEEMIALRHQSPLKSTNSWSMGKFERFALGFIMNAAMMIPLVNFFIPVIGVAAATHVMHRPKK